MTVSQASAFCGFYVGKADGSLFNEASRVVIARSGERTVVTMANDYQGDFSEFGIVIPVPTFLERNQIHLAEPSLLDRLDAFTAPRLVEYFDQDPCAMQYLRQRDLNKMSARADAPVGKEEDRSEFAHAHGVTIDASYSIGEYSIEMIRATNEQGLVAFLTGSGYKLPDGAAPVLGSYLKQGMRFFIAKVDQEAQSQSGRTFLRPIQVAYESKKFTLPIRLGMLNANGPQDLLVWILSDNGRAETVNYRTVKLPTGQEIPTFARDRFAEIYPAIFQEQVRREQGRAVFLEYAWNMSWCDPCAADPLSPEELRGLGVSWLDEPTAAPVFVSRLHVRYTKDTFPEDLRFQTTGDTTNFQGRYVLRQPWTGQGSCPAAQNYRVNLSKRREREAATLANLTGWPISEVRRRMREDGLPITQPQSWWQRLWGTGKSSR
jgi:hypothetical protein